MTPFLPCLFCRIARREVPAHIVYEDDYLVAFLDTGPIRPGHVQIIPRDHYPTFDDLTAELASRIIILGQRLARILKRSNGVSRAAFLFTGGDIAHAHAHVLPMIAAERHHLQALHRRRGDHFPADPAAERGGTRPGGLHLARSAQTQGGRAMKIRRASPRDAEAASLVLRRSITELCLARSRK